MLPLQCTPTQDCDPHRLTPLNALQQHWEQLGGEHRGSGGRGEGGEKANDCLRSAQLINRHTTSQFIHGQVIDMATCEVGGARACEGREEGCVQGGEGLSPRYTAVAVQGVVCDVPARVVL